MDRSTIDGYPAPMPGGAQPRTRALRFLVVDDVSDVGEMLALALATLGCTSRHARSADEALDVVAEAAPDVVLFEPFMRDATLTDFATRVRTHCERAGRAVPRIVATSHVEEPAGFAAHERLDGYFLKPVSIEAIFDQLVRDS